ncbi:hypothetical protein [Martelella radicis]|uniref:Uncharacterized protein n=1 Tax=Martelella radicis TaxID=1397476 RepID=A0A7W6KHI2_9HYPH|nr:hypothetical protein [Martelella radicis]MBB4121311.1 hypothetical protein [Martelella radicis]
MKDADNEGYRSFARGGLTAVVTVNSGALVALVSQLSSLKDPSNGPCLKASFICWVAGIVLGLLAWATAAAAAQSFANEKYRREAFFAAAGFLLFFLSILSFIAGVGFVFQAVFPS